MNKIKTTISAFFISIIAMQPYHAQAQIDVAKNDLAEVYKSYDRIKYLSFDVAYLYSSDTLNGDFTHSEVKGSYQINGRNTLYKLGDITFMQNDSILIGVYTLKKLIILGDPQTSALKGGIPMRDQMDSLFKMQEQYYDVTVSSKSKYTTISFKGLESTAQFIKYEIVYDNNTNFIKKLEHSFRGITDKDLTDPSMEDSTRHRLAKEIRLKKLTISFSNYSHAKIDKENFDEKNYIAYDNKMYKPAVKYSDYKIYDTRKKK
jgi:hypothetical protein